MSNVRISKKGKALLKNKAVAAAVARTIVSGEKMRYATSNGLLVEIEISGNKVTIKKSSDTANPD